MGGQTSKNYARSFQNKCALKGDVNMGLLCNRYVLITASRIEDYVNLLSKPIFYIAHRNWNYTMRTLKWDPLFDPEEETSIAIAWIFTGIATKLF